MGLCLNKADARLHSCDAYSCEHIPVLLNMLVMGLCLKKGNAQLHLCDYAYSCEHSSCFTEHACYVTVLEEG